MLRSTNPLTNQYVKMQFRPNLPFADITEGFNDSYKEKGFYPNLFQNGTRIDPLQSTQLLYKLFPVPGFISTHFYYRITEIAPNVQPESRTYDERISEFISGSPTCIHSDCLVQLPDGNQQFDGLKDKVYLHKHPLIGIDSTLSLIANVIPYSQHFQEDAELNLL